jgi:hypothetical protein
MIYVVHGWVAHPIRRVIKASGKNIALREAIKEAKRWHEDGDGPEPIWTDTPHWTVEKV